MLIKHSVGRLALAGLAFSASPVTGAPRCSDVPVVQKALAVSSSPLQQRLLYRGSAVQPDQSFRPTAPYAPQPWSIDLIVDEVVGGVKYDFGQAIAGDFYFRDRAGFLGGRGYALDYIGRSEPIEAMPQLHLGFVPKLLLQAIAAQSECELRGKEGDRDVVRVVNFSGGSRDLVFDALGRLIQSRRPAQPVLYGTLQRTTNYGAYRKVDGAWIPGRIELRASNPVHGGYRSVLMLQSATPARLSRSDAQPPPGTPLAPKRDTQFRIVPKGEDVYLLRNVTTVGRFSYNVLLVGQRDRVLVLDAVADDATSKKVQAEATRLFPGKPLTLIVTHPHGDHVAGLTPYLDKGTPIIGPRGMTDLLDKVRQPGETAVSVQEAHARMLLADPRNPVELMDFGSAHAEHLLVAYLPKQRLLLQADLINQGDYPAHAHSRALLRWIKARKLDVTEIAGVHGASVRPDEPLL